MIKQPIGVAASITPWNFPINQAVRKISAAMAAGCSVILKGPEETPASCAALVNAYVDAGLPSGVLNLVFGVPSDISEYLIAHPVIRKISFTGSTPVGKRLAALAGSHMKRVTMELGGHAPALVFEDADVKQAAKLLSAAKFRNAGQVCVSPTRFMVHERVYDDFVEQFTAAAKALVVGDGLDEATQMGPLANLRRVEAMDALIMADVVEREILDAVTAKLILRLAPPLAASATILLAAHGSVEVAVTTIERIAHSTRHRALLLVGAWALAARDRGAAAGLLELLDPNHPAKRSLDLGQDELLPNTVLDNLGDARIRKAVRHWLKYSIMKD